MKEGWKLEYPDKTPGDELHCRNAQWTPAELRFVKGVATPLGQHNFSTLSNQHKSGDPHKEEEQMKKKKWQQQSQQDSPPLAETIYRKCVTSSSSELPAISKVVGNFGSEADVRSLYYRRFRSMKLPTSAHVLTVDQRSKF